MLKVSPNKEKIISYSAEYLVVVVCNRNHNSYYSTGIGFNFTGIFPWEILISFYSRLLTLCKIMEVKYILSLIPNYYKATSSCIVYATCSNIRIPNMFHNIDQHTKYTHLLCCLVYISWTVKKIIVIY